MKKIALLFFIFLNLHLCANADVMPYYMHSLRRCGIGYTQVVSPVVMKREVSPTSETLEVLHFNFKEEVTTCEINQERCQIDEVFAAGGVDRIMFDNFSVEMTAEAVKKVAGRCQTESSGGITLDTLRDYALTGVDFISVGALTHQIKSLDMSLKACE